jgi:hypothetical protein
MTPYLYPIALKKGIISGEVFSIKLVEALYGSQMKYRALQLKCN